ncbi:CsbD family protein [Sporobolomyces koalae]|uniref:CsbD family protein n=1 Tax=Sporobolomyces koalae TaxID=500713 RepID=UPI0031804B2D
MQLYQTYGNINSVVGGITQSIGDATGIQSLSQSGAEQKASGDAEHAAATAQGYVEGTADRLGGKVDRVVGAVTGDKAKEADGLATEQKGKAQQAANS